MQIAKTSEALNVGNSINLILTGVNSQCKKYRGHGISELFAGQRF